MKTALTGICALAAILALALPVHAIPVTSDPAEPPVVAASPIAGDTNGDGVIDSSDYIILKMNMGSPATGGIAAADFNGNGVTDWYDFQQFLVAMNTPQAMPPVASAVPEPLTMGLFGLGIVVLGRHAKRRLKMPKA